MFFLCVGLLLTGCASAAEPSPVRDFILVTDAANSTATPTPFRPSAATTDSPLPEGEGLGVRATPTATVAPTDEPLPIKSPPLPQGEGLEVRAEGRPQYSLVAELDYASHTLAVDETIIYTNQTDIPLEEIVLSVEPNRWSNAFTLHSLRVDGFPITTYELKVGRLDITLDEPLVAGETIEVGLNFAINIPVKSYEEVFGYLSYQTNVVNWYPFVVPYHNGWILHEPSGVGEHLVYDAADFDVRLRIIGADDLIVAASAEGKVAGEWTLYQLEGARTFVFSVSPRYSIETDASEMARVMSYFFPSYDEAGKGILEAASRAMSIYSDRFAPYPYESLSIVQTELPSGMEYDGLVFMSTEFYDEYDGTIKNNLISIGVHEISHQWWFGMVGSDQAMEPWLDEAMALYSERIFYETVFPYPVTWWWRFRVDWFSPTGWVDISIYDGYGFRLYTNAVYLRGAHFLEDIRARIGEKAFNAFLRDYATTYARGHVTGDDFFAILDRNTVLGYDDIVDAYFLHR